jgi:DNA-binding beta-propeller fold protein YncE
MENTSESSLPIIDEATNSCTEKLKWYRKGLSANTTGLCAYEDLLLVCGEDPQSMLILSLEDGSSVQGSVEFPLDWAWKGDLIGIALSPAKDKMFVICRTSNKIFMFSAKKDPISKVTHFGLLKEIKGETPWALAYLNRDTIITTSEKESILVLYSSDTLAEIGRINLPSKDTGIAVDKNHNIYYTSRSDNSVSLIKKKPQKDPNHGFSLDHYQKPLIIAGGGQTRISSVGQSLRGDQIKFNTLHSICISPQGDIFICQSHRNSPTGESFIFRIRKTTKGEEEESKAYKAEPVYMLLEDGASGLGLCLDSRNNIYFSTYSAKSVARIDLYNISDQLLLFYSGFFDSHSTVRSLLKEIIFIVAQFSVLHT